MYISLTTCNYEMLPLVFYFLLDVKLFGFLTDSDLWTLAAARYSLKERRQFVDSDLFMDLYHTFIAMGNLRLVIWAVERMDCNCMYMPYVVVHNRVMTVYNYFISSGARVQSTFVFSVINHGNTRLLSHMLANNVSFPERMMDVLYSNLSIMSPYPLNADTVISMIDTLKKAGYALVDLSPKYVKVLEYLMTTYRFTPSVELWKDALWNGHTEIVEYYIANGYEKCAIDLDIYAIPNKEWVVSIMERCGL